MPQNWGTQETHPKIFEIFSKISKNFFKKISKKAKKRN